MSRRINGTTQTAVSGQRNLLAACIMCALAWLMLVAPQTALADEGDQAYNGWVLSEAVVVSMPEALGEALDLDARTLHTTWQAEHGRGLSDYTWTYDVSLTWSAPPAILAAGDSSPLSWQIENSNANPLILHEDLAWCFYAPELRWAGLGDPDTLPCDHSPAYLGYDESEIGRSCDAITRAPTSSDDRMAIVLEGGLYQHPEWQNMIIQYIYVPTILQEAAAPDTTETAMVTSGWTRFIAEPGTSQPVVSNDNASRWVSPAEMYLAYAPNSALAI